MNLVVTITDADGTERVVYDGPAPTATQEEIDDAVDLIEYGCDAHTAMMLAKQGRL